MKDAKRGVVQSLTQKFRSDRIYKNSRTKDAKENIEFWWIYSNIYSINSKMKDAKRGVVQSLTYIETGKKQ